MARIQILELPMKHVGEFTETPFMLVFDQLETSAIVDHTGQTVRTLDDGTQDLIEQMGPELKAASGAVGVIVFPGELEIG